MNKQPPKIGDKIKVNGLEEETIGIYKGDALDNFGGWTYALIEVERKGFFLKARFWLIELFKGKKLDSYKKSRIEHIFHPSISHWEVLERNKKRK